MTTETEAQMISLSTNFTPRTKYCDILYKQLTTNLRRRHTMNRNHDDLTESDHDHRVQFHSPMDRNLDETY